MKMMKRIIIKFLTHLSAEKEEGLIPKLTRPILPMEIKYKYMKTKFITFITIGLFAISWTSCEKLLVIERDQDSTLQPIDTAMQTTADMQALLNSCYDIMANAYAGNQQNLSELLSNNLNAPYTHDDYTEVYNRNTLFFNGTIGNFYGDPYTVILRTNTLLENFDRIKDLTAEDKLRFTAESRFMRAVNHYEIAQLFAQPYGFTSDNSHPGIALRDKVSIDPIPRSTVAEVYNFVIQDLKFAEENLPVSNVTDGIPYADQWAAKAMLARVYFQMNDFQNASDYAGQVIDQGPFTLDSLNARWSDDISTENIFTLVKSLVYNSGSSLRGNYRDDGNLPTLRASKDYYDALYGFLGTPNDKRRKWLDVQEAGSPTEFYSVNRFDAETFNIPFLNLTEIMLIRAESNGELGSDLVSAINDLNLIKQRAGIGNLNEGSSADIVILNAQSERVKEMIGEGRYTYDLKRRGANGDDIMVRGAPWNCPGMILQFPNSENTSNFEMNETGGCN
jgi:tetratricopeptide (TPR) repeat protein